MTVAPHAWDAAGLPLLRDALTTPYRRAAGLTRLAVEDGELAVHAPVRTAVVLVALREPLADEALVLRATRDGQPLPPVVFAPYSHAGTALPLWRPPTAEGTLADDVSFDITLRRVAGPGSFDLLPSGGDTLDDEDVRDLVEGQVLSGTLGALLYLASAEKQRLIRTGRELSASRFVGLARAGALDDAGADVRVPRRRDLPGEEPGESVAESDEVYRARLAIYRRWWLPSPAVLDEALNGPGERDDPNAGLPSKVGVAARFRVVDADNELALAFKVVIVGDAGQRERLDGRLTGSHLFDLDHAPPAALPSERRERYEAIRRRLDDGMLRSPLPDAAPPRYLAPLLAAGLDRALRLARHLGLADPLELRRAYDLDGGSRFEIGLGAVLTRLSEAQLGALAEAAADAEPAGEDPEIDALLAGLEPREPGDDPVGRWLWEPCGLPTSHPLDDELVYLSPLTSGGLHIDGPTVVPVMTSAGAGLPFYRCLYDAPAGPAGRHVRAAEALERVPSRFSTAGLDEPPGALDPEELDDAVERIASAEELTLPPVVEGLSATGLLPEDLPGYAQTLQSSANRAEIVALPFEQTRLEELAEQAGELAEALRPRVSALLAAGFGSVRALWDPGTSRLLLLASVTVLPGGETEPGEPPPAAYHWQAGTFETSTPGESHPARLFQVYGSMAKLFGEREGIGLVAVAAYVRRGGSDPYQVRVELPDDGEDGPPLLDPGQYGYVMNLLDHLHPAGIGVNTFDLRRNHVDVDADRRADWLSSSASRTYDRDRQRGAGRPVRPYRPATDQGATP